jgi:hypothetical protein
LKWTGILDRERQHENHLKEYHRARVAVSGEADCGADAFFAVLMDFGGVMRWMPKENPPLHLLKVELTPGHVVGQRPCIRRAFQDKSHLPEAVRPLIPDIVEEELLCVDAESRTLSYNLIGEPYGMRNYVAVIEVDRVGPQKCRVSCTSRWDTQDVEGRAAIVAAVEDLFRRGMIEGIARLARAGN